MLQAVGALPGKKQVPQVGLWLCQNIMYQRRSAQLTAYRNQYLLECAAESQHRGSDPLYILIHLEQARHLWNAFYMLDKIERRIIFQRVFFQKAPRTLAQELCLTRRQVLDLYEGRA